MIKERIIELWKQSKQKASDLIDETFSAIAQLFGEDNQTKLNTNPFQLILDGSPANFDNSIIESRIANFEISKQKEQNEIMQRIKLIKNARIREDGRLQWRKMINGRTYQIIDNNYDNFRRRIKNKLLEIKNAINKTLTPQTRTTLFQLITIYYTRNIKSQVEKGTIKYVSALRYEDAMKLLTGFNRQIQTYTKDDIIDFFNKTKQHRTGAYCYYLIKRVFADEFEKGNLKSNPIASLKNPFSQKRCSEKGSWLNLKEQQTLKANLDDSIFSKEILFYLLTGCRLKESYDAKIDFEKCLLHINRH